MTALVLPALLAWFPIVILFYLFMRPHRAMIASVVAGMLFLPEVHMTKTMPEAPDPVVFVILKLTKENVVCFSVLLGAFLFDLKHLFAFRPRWFDLPMLCWCVIPFFSNLDNGIGTYDSFAAMRDQVLTWGMPYFLGRLYLGEPEYFRDMAVGILLGGLIYVPLCAYEMAIFPSLHHRFFGYHANDPSQLERGGGYRPIVFMQHGLAVGMWMVGASLFAGWLWRTRAVTRLEWERVKIPVPIIGATLAILATTALVRSTGALVLGVVGALALTTSVTISWIKWPILPIALLLVSPIYIVGRGWVGTQPVGWVKADFNDEKKMKELEYQAMKKPLFGWGGVTGEQFIAALTAAFSEDRAKSMQFRLKYEDVVLEKSLDKPWLGWGDTGKAREIGTQKKITTGEAVVVDGKWILSLGNYGIVGLTSQWLAMLLPSILFFWRFRTSLWTAPNYAAGAVAAVFLTLYMIDCLINSMDNAIYIVLAGGLMSLAGVKQPLAPPSRPARPAQTTQIRREVQPQPTMVKKEQPTAPPPGVLTRRRPSS